MLASPGWSVRLPSSQSSGSCSPFSSRPSTSASTQASSAVCFYSSADPLFDDFTDIHDLEIDYDAPQLDAMADLLYSSYLVPRAASLRLEHSPDFDQIQDRATPLPRTPASSHPLSLSCCDSQTQSRVRSRPDLVSSACAASAIHPTSSSSSPHSPATCTVKPPSSSLPRILPSSLFFRELGWRPNTPTPCEPSDTDISLVPLKPSKVCTHSLLHPATQAVLNPARLRIYATERCMVLRQKLLHEARAQDNMILCRDAIPFCRRSKCLGSSPLRIQTIP